MNQKQYAALLTCCVCVTIATITLYKTAYIPSSGQRIARSEQMMSGQSQFGEGVTSNLSTATTTPLVLPTTVTNQSSPMTATETTTSLTEFYVGVALACGSSLFIGASFVFKKKGLLNLSVRAGDGGYGYLKEPMWWAGLLLMASGEAANFTAYAFAPASLVTPLGALSVIVAALLASYFLKERLNLIGKVGCSLCVVGSTVIVIHSPEEQQVTTMAELAQKLIDPGFIVYVCLVAIVSLVMIFYYAPKMGQQNVLIYIIICSVVGSLSVMGCKAIGLAIVQTIHGQNQFVNWLTYFFIVQLTVCICIQMIYLNKALDTFNTSVVTPIYYVFFTTFVIIASAILYKEWGNMDVKDVLGNLCGFLTVVGGIFLLNAFRDMNISWRDISSATKKTTDTSEPSESHNETHQLLENDREDRVFGHSSASNSISRGSI